MKFLSALVFSAILIGSAYASDASKIECYGINFNLFPVAKNDTIQLKKEDQQFHIMFTGNINGKSLKVVIQKSSMDVSGYIENEGTSQNFTGAFTESGRFEFNSMSGGNVMMPAKLIGISCMKEE